MPSTLELTLWRSTLAGTSCRYLLPALGDGLSAHIKGSQESLRR